MTTDRTRKLALVLFVLACLGIWIFIGVQLHTLLRRPAPIAETIETANLPTFPARTDPHRPVELVPEQMSPRAARSSSSDLDILLLGFDLSEKGLAGRTDAILIARVKPRSGQVGIISVPRDLWVDIPGELPGRINKVYRVGDRLHGRGGGHALLKQVILNTLGIEINYTVSVDFSGFSAMVDLLDGVNVNVACPIKDNFKVPGRPGEYEYFEADAGVQRFTGKQALYFTRSRHGRSDLDRSTRQQAVLMGILRRLSDADVWLKFPYIATQASKYIATDMPTRKIISLAQKFRNVDTSRIHGLVLREPTVYQLKSDDGQSVLALNEEKYLDDVEHLFRAKAPGRPLRPVCIDEDAALHWKQKPGAPGKRLTTASNNIEASTDDSREGDSL